MLETAGKCFEWVRDHLALDEVGIYLDSAGAVGVAITACAGLKGEDALDLAKRLIKADRIYTPDPGPEEVYRRNYEVFKRLYRSNRRYFRDLNA